MAFMCLATWLYLNACGKGEECIPQTWDMFHEKWGFLVIFWNFAGVPFVSSYSISIRFACQWAVLIRYRRSSVVHLFGRLHGHPRPGELPHYWTGKLSGENPYTDDRQAASRMVG